MAAKLPLNPKTEIFRWGPAPGKFYYESEFVDAIFHVFPKLFPGYAWSPALFLFRNNQILWINEHPALRRAGAKVFLRYMLPKRPRLDLYRRWGKVVSELQVLERSWDKIDWRKISDEQLYELGLLLYDLLVDFWIPTVPQELGNYGSDHLLEQGLARSVPDAGERQKVMEALTAPEELSFYQQEELALGKAKDLAAHQRRYFWLHNSYNGTRVLPVSFFAKRKKELAKNLPQQLAGHLRAVRQAKRNAQQRYRLPKAVMNIAEALSSGVSWQDERKQQIFIYLHYKELFLREVARRRGYRPGELLSASTGEVIEALRRDLRPRLKRRRRVFGFFCRTGNVQELTPAETLRYWKRYGEEAVRGTVKEIRGTVASSVRGPVRGRVRVVLDPFKAKGFRTGDVLVAPMTSPEYVFLMKRAAAVVTDAGGLTSHAAIVSRELGKACIVGTKVATRVLKDGDRVEVDSEKGTVKILK